MREWAKIFHSPKNAIRLNIHLAKSLAHCPPLEAGGWNFRCVECHVATGTYSAGFGYGWHAHKEYQLEIAVSGSFEFTTKSSEKFIVRPGHALVVPWKMVHQWKCLKPGLMVGISLELLPTPESIRRDGCLIERIRLVQSPALRVMVDDLIATGLDTGHLSFQSKSTACRLFLLLAEIMEQLIPSRIGEENPITRIAADERGREMVTWVVRHIDENLGMKFCLAEIARGINLSTRQVHRLFLKHLGKSLHDYLLERRLELARKLLAERGSKMQVKEVAFTCGFNSHAYFCNSFRRAYGVAPSAIMLDEVSLKSGFTVEFHTDPQESPGPAVKRKRAPTSAASKQRG